METDPFGSIELIGGPHDGEERPTFGPPSPGASYYVMAPMPFACYSSVDPLDASVPSPRRVFVYRIGYQGTATYEGEEWR